MDNFIDNIKQETNGELIGDLDIVRIPLNLYCANNATNRKWPAEGGNEHPFNSSPVFMLGDAALGSPYSNQSLGLKSAIHLAGLIGQRNLPLPDMLNRYELYMYKQWLRVYMRSKMIKHNKDLLETMDDPFGLLELLHLLDRLAIVSSSPMSTKVLQRGSNVPTNL